MTGLGLDLLLGFAIGVSLGTLGGGGSILTVPALVYLVGQSPQVAVTTSLAIVGANSMMGAFFHRAQGTLNWRVAAVFGGSGMIMSYLSSGLSKHFSPNALMVAFALLMLIVGGLLLFRRQPQAEQFARD
ncbi:MAG: sulfite exporter TauE/SafE family protein, partial [Anaerolinea sp.]|nr:sulfite exporter TauE/SafE family protein [Anaerolinea sp.]